MVGPKGIVAFDAKVEGGCGQSTIDLVFDAAGCVTEIGPVEESPCGR